MTSLHILVLVNPYFRPPFPHPLSQFLLEPFALSIFPLLFCITYVLLFPFIFLFGLQNSSFPSSFLVCSSLCINHPLTFHLLISISLLPTRTLLGPVLLCSTFISPCCPASLISTYPWHRPVFNF